MKACCLGLGIFAVSASLSADDWARFRGPDGSGVAPAAGIPTSFTESDYVWSADLPGTGHSSPVLWGDRIFLVCIDPESGERRSLVCFSASDGSVLWKNDYDFEPHSLHKFNNAASTTPCVDQNHVYMTWATGDRREVITVDHDGRERWRKVVGNYVENHGSGASPVLVDGVLVVQNDHVGEGAALMGLDPATGDVLWKRERKPVKTSFATPVVFRPGGGGAQVVFSGSPYGLTALDPKTGELLWQSEDEFSHRTVASPVVVGDLIFTTCGQGGGGKGSMAVRPKSGEESTPSEYQVRNGLPYVPTPVTKDGLIFLWTDSGIVNCVRAEDGESLWRERASGPTYASPLVIGENVYGFSKKGEVVCVRAGDSFEIIGTSDVGEPINATPAVSDGRLYIRTETKLICVGEKSDDAQS